MHMTFVNCVNHVISEGIKGVIGDAKGWEEKPKTQIALSKLLVPELNISLRNSVVYEALFRLVLLVGSTHLLDWCH